MNIPVDAEFQGLCNGASHFVKQSTCVELLLAQKHNPISVGRHNCMHAITPHRRYPYSKIIKIRLQDSSAIRSNTTDRAFLHWVFSCCNDTCYMPCLKIMQAK